MATTRDLADLASLKAYMVPLAETTRGDVVLARILTSVSRGIEQYLSRHLVAESYTELRHGNGLESMRTKNWPIISVAAVTINGHTVTPAQGPTGPGYINDEQFIYLRPGGVPGGGGGRFAPGIKNVALSYAAGYLTPGQVALAGLPEWTAEKPTAPGAQILPGNGCVYTASGEGATGATAPAWPTTIGAAVVDGLITWRCTAAYVAPPAGAEPLPDDIVVACLELTSYAATMRTRMGDTSVGEGPQRVSFMLKNMHPRTKEALDLHRAVVPIADVVMPGAAGAGRW